MRIKLLNRMAGPEGNRPAGSVISVNDKTGEALVFGGYAINLDPPKPKAKPKQEPKKVPEKKSKSKSTGNKQGKRPAPKKKG